jgi:hypothetical protein
VHQALNRPGRGAANLIRALVLTVVGLSWLAGPSAAPLDLGDPEPVAPGVVLYRVQDVGLLAPPGPLAARLLRLDPTLVDLRLALAQDQVLGVEGVLEISSRYGALAGINAGFFDIKTGEPMGALRLDGDLVSDMPVPRGAVGFGPSSGDGPLQLLFDRLTVQVSILVADRGRARRVAVDGVDTRRGTDRLVLYSPRFSDHTATSETGIEWIARGTPLEIVERREKRGSAVIPRDGVVLSYGGLRPPAALDGLQAGARIDVTTDYRPRLGSTARQWAETPYIVGGAGLLRLRGKTIDSWRPERFTRADFVDGRHPRTLVGVGAAGEIWLIAIDGRQPGYSLGMTFRELQRLVGRLELVDALNLDGGGSTTMVVRGRIVNRPSDPAGPRKVSDALLVFLRR